MMAEYLIEEEKLTELADILREKYPTVAEVCKLVTDRASFNVDALPESVTEIGPYAFYGCESLALTELPESVTDIGHAAFQNCKNLALTKLPDGLLRIGTIAAYGSTSGYQFYNCENLAITEIPASVIGIYGNFAFSNCKGLTTITFNGTPESIDSTVFNGCTNLLTINVPWAEGEVANAPWSATNATINYNYTEG